MSGCERNGEIPPGEKKRDVSLLEIFLTFLKIGTLGFGGGPALISVIKQEATDKKGWVDEETFLQGLAVSLLPPGSMMVNVAFFVGDVLRGFPGGLLALLGILLPSFFIVLALGVLTVSMGKVGLQGGALKGMAPAVAGILVAMVFKLSREHVRQWWGVVLVAGSTVAMYFLKVPPHVVIIAAIAAAWLIWMLGAGRSAPPLLCQGQSPPDAGPEGGKGA